MNEMTGGEAKQSEEGTSEEARRVEGVTRTERQKDGEKGSVG